MIIDTAPTLQAFAKICAFTISIAILVYHAQRARRIIKALPDVTVPWSSYVQELFILMLQVVSCSFLIVTNTMSGIFELIQIASGLILLATAIFKSFKFKYHEKSFFFPVYCGIITVFTCDKLISFFGIANPQHIVSMMISIALFNLVHINLHKGHARSSLVALIMISLARLNLSMQILHSDSLLLMYLYFIIAPFIYMLFFHLWDVYEYVNHVDNSSNLIAKFANVVKDYFTNAQGAVMIRRYVYAVVYAMNLLFTVLSLTNAIIYAGSIATGNDLIKAQWEQKTQENSQNNIVQIQTDPVQINTTV